MDLTSLLDSMTLNESKESNITNFAVKIGDQQTDIVLGSFPNRQLIIISQYSKVGNLYKVTIDEPGNGLSISEPVYTINTLLGNSNIEAEAACRYIAETLAIKKPLMIFMNLIEYNRDTVKSIVESIRTYLQNQ